MTLPQNEGFRILGPTSLALSRERRDDTWDAGAAFFPGLGG
jgi:hypothetical protein